MIPVPHMHAQHAHARVHVHAHVDGWSVRSVRSLYTHLQSRETTKGTPFVRILPRTLCPAHHIWRSEGGARCGRGGENPTETSTYLRTGPGSRTGLCSRSLIITSFCGIKGGASFLRGQYKCAPCVRDRRSTAGPGTQGKFSWRSWVPLNFVG